VLINTPENRGICFAVQNTSSYVYPDGMTDALKVNEAGETRINTSAGHLSLHVEGAHPAEIEFAFDREPKRLSVAFVASAVIDTLLVALLIVASRYRPAISASAILPEEPNKNIIWL